MRHGARRLQVHSSGAPDWDAEMSIFQKRASKPNQLNTIRKLVEEVDTGRVTSLTDFIRLGLQFTHQVLMQVLYAGDSLAILEGLNNDAPVGASLRFVSGASGSVGHHRCALCCMQLVH